MTTYFNCNYDGMAENKQVPFVCRCITRTTCICMHAEGNSLQMHNEHLNLKHQLEERLHAVNEVELGPSV